MKLYKILINSLILGLFATGCSSLEEREEISTTAGKQFEVEKNIAWEALIEVFKHYPKTTINEESGIIETEELRGSQIWEPAHTKKRMRGIIFYKLKAVLTNDDPSYIHARIRKTIKRKKDFFSKMEAIPSDLLEEQTLLYRLGREIQMKRLIEKIYKENKK